MLANRTFLVRLRMGLPRLVKPREATWVENAFWGRRHTASLTFNDVRPRAMFPLYLENRHRVIRLADEPSQLIINFAHAGTLKIQDVFPQTASRRKSETLESTEVVSLFLDHSEGRTPQVLTVQFGYYTGWQSWAPVLIPILDDDDRLRAVYERLDGIVFPGGADVAPEEYGEAPIDNLNVVEAPRDRTELTLARWAFADDLPVLGICRGQQLLNVALGGSLIQDLASDGTAHPRSVQRTDLSHAIRVEPNSRLAGISPQP